MPVGSEPEGGWRDFFENLLPLENSHEIPNENP
jgi:hypothetical protein